MLRILVIEDDEGTRASLVEVLSAEGYFVETASDGREALAMLQRQDLPDVVLLDLGMPVVDGYEVARVIGEVPRYADLPVIILSAWSPTPKETAFRFPILRKPIVLETLLAAVQAVTCWTTEVPTDRASIPPLVDDDGRARTSRQLCCLCGQRAATRCTGCGSAFCERCIAIGAGVDERAAAGSCDLCWTNRQPSVGA